MHDSSGRQHNPPRYEIRIQGHLAPRWATQFEGMTLTTHSDGTTVLEGPVIDQAALHGLLTRVRDLGLPLLSITQRPTDSPTSHPSAPAPSQGD